MKRAARHALAAIDSCRMLLRQDQFALTGFPQSVDLSFALNPNFLTAAGERIEFDDFGQLWDYGIVVSTLGRVIRRSAHFNLNLMKSYISGKLGDIPIATKKNLATILTAVENQSQHKR